MDANRVSSCVVAVATVVVGACASQEPAPVAVAPEISAAEAQQLAADAKVVDVQPVPPGAGEAVCRKENVTGSHRPRLVCQTAAQRSATREAAQEWYRTGGRTGEISHVPAVN